MNSKEKLRRKLVWKYFWKRKREEFWEMAKDYYPVLLIILWTISLLITTQYPKDSTIFIVGLCIAILPVILAYIGLIVFIFYALFLAFTKWIKQNWEWATEDADRELNKRKRNK